MPRACSGGSGTTGRQSSPAADNAASERNGVRMSHAAAVGLFRSSPAGTATATAADDDAAAALAEATVPQIEVQSSRFGKLTVDADRLPRFPRRLLGFPNYEP